MKTTIFKRKTTLDRIHSRLSSAEEKFSGNSNRKLEFDPSPLYILQILISTQCD